jgi:hypothetical protein
MCESRAVVSLVKWSMCESRAVVSLVKWSMCDSRAVVSLVKWSMCESRAVVSLVKWSMCECRAVVSLVKWSIYLLPWPSTYETYCTIMHLIPSKITEISLSDERKSLWSVFLQFGSLSTKYLAGLKNLSLSRLCFIRPVQIRTYIQSLGCIRPA